jgi:hypothetical protein
MASVTLVLSDLEATLVRRALLAYTANGADGCLTICTDLVAEIDNQQSTNEGSFTYGEQDDDLDNYEDNMTDAEADADTLASAGWGTDEDYGYHGGDE